MSYDVLRHLPDSAGYVLPGHVSYRADYQLQGTDPTVQAITFEDTDTDTYPILHYLVSLNLWGDCIKGSMSDPIYRRKLVLKFIRVH